MGFEAKIQQKINAYKQSNPKVKLSDEQILSILVKNGDVVLTDDQKRSLFANNSKHNDNIGLKLEKTAKKPNPEKTIYLQSGRKVVYSRLSNGKTVMKYFGADGTRINPDYFKKVEGQISISADGNSYTVTKNGKKQTLKAKNPTQGAVDQNIAKLNNQEKALNKTKNEQGWIGKGWDLFKNTTGSGDGSDKVQQQIDAEKKLLNQIKTGKVSKKDFKEVTGLDYTKENLEKFKRGELSQTEEKINGYKEGQDMAADVAGDMVSGIAAVAIYTAAVAAAPVTGGASIAVGVGLATASGAAIKIGIKALDTVGTDKKYTFEDMKHDAATGGFSGALAPVTAGLGGAVGKTIATKFGIQAVKSVGKEVAEEAAKGGLKSTLKTALTNPAGYEYAGGTLLKRGSAMAAEMATDGALSGAVDGGFRAGLDSDWDTEAMLDGAIEGGIGGAIMSPVVGGGMKAAGKGGEKLIKIHEGHGFTYKTFLGKKFQFRLNKDEMQKIQFIKHDNRTQNLNPTNLTNELKKFRYWSPKIKEMMANNPNLSPIVGKLPQKWGKTVASKEGLQKIDKIFYGMSQKFYIGQLMTSDVANAEKELAQILKVPVKIEVLGQGLIGFTFKMTIDNQKYVLKCFKNINYSQPHLKSAHGNYNELAGAVYASKHDPKHFAKFYFGRFGENEDGYMVTKFIEKSDSRDEYQFSFKEYTKLMDSSDKGHNVIGSKIIDFGGAFSETALENFNHQERKILNILAKALDDNNASLIKAIQTKYANSKDFNNPINYIKALVHSYAFAHKYKNNLVIEYFLKRKECFDILGLEILPPINHLGKNAVDIEDGGRIAAHHQTYFGDAGKYYGLEGKEWKKLFGNYGLGEN